VSSCHPGRKARVGRQAHPGRQARQGRPSCHVRLDRRAHSGHPARSCRRAHPGCKAVWVVRPIRVVVPVRVARSSGPSGSSGPFRLSGLFRFLGLPDSFEFLGCLTCFRHWFCLVRSGFRVRVTHQVIGPDRLVWFVGPAYLVHIFRPAQPLMVVGPVRSV